jgi:hypothetical protein
MCLGGQSKPSAPKPQALPPASPPPAPAPEPVQAPTDLQDNKEGTKLKAKSSAREKAGIINKGSGQLRIPLNTGTDKAPTGGLNV